MPYYLAPYIGSGVKGDPFRPSGSDQDGWAAIDLRADGGATLDGGGLNACLLYLPTPSAAKGLDLLADDSKEKVAASTVAKLLSQLGLSKADATDFDAAILEIVTGPPANGWRAVKDRVHLGPLSAEVARAVDVGPIVKIGGMLLCTLGCHVWLAELGRWMPTLAGASALATDNFNRANSADLGAAWDVMTSESAFSIASNTVVPPVFDGTESNNSVTWPNDQYSQAKVTISSISGGGQGIGVAVRCATGARTYYRIVTDKASSNNLEIAKFVAGAYTQLGLRTSTWVNGDVLETQVVGTTLTSKQNGAVLGSDITDSAIASGRAGISHSSSTTGASLDDWEGGDFAAAGTSLTPTVGVATLAGTAPSRVLGTILSPVTP